jgi:hypothetical protein
MNSICRIIGGLVIGALGSSCGHYGTLNHYRDVFTRASSVDIYSYRSGETTKVTSRSSLAKLFAHTDISFLEDERFRVNPNDHFDPLYRVSYPAKESRSPAAVSSLYVNGQGDLYYVASMHAVYLKREARYLNCIDELARNQEPSRRRQTLTLDKTPRRPGSQRLQ